MRRRALIWLVACLCAFATVATGGALRASESARGLLEAYLSMALSDPLEPYGVQRLLEIAPELGGLDALCDSLEARLQTARDPAALHLVLGRLHASAGRHAAARASFEAAERARPGRHEAPWLIALGLRAEGRLQDALPAFDRAIAALGPRIPFDDRLALISAAVDTAGEIGDSARAERYAAALGAGGRADGRSRIEEARLLARAGAIDASVERWRALERQSAGRLSEQVLIWRELAEVLERAGRIAEAEALWWRGIERLPRGHHERPLFWQGLAALARADGRLAELVQTLRAEHERDDEALVLLGSLEEELGRHAEALRTWTEAARRMPRREDVRLSRTRVLEQTGSAEEVLKAWAEVVRLFPREPRHRFAWVDRLLAAGKSEDARAELKAIGRLFGRDPSVLQQATVRWLRLGDAADHPAIEALFRQVLRADPYESAHRISYGSWLHSLGRTDEALTIWGAIASGAGPRGPQQLELAEVLLEHDLFDEATRALDKALEAAPGDPTYLRLRAQIHERKGDKASAVTVWRTILERAAPGSTLAREAEGRVLELWAALRRLDVELQRLSAARDKGPLPPHDEQLLILGLIERGERGRAEGIIEDAIAEGRGGASSLHLAEHLAATGGQFEAALGYAERLAAEEPDTAFTHLRRAADYARELGDRERSIALIRRGTAMNPGHLEAHRSEAELLLAFGEEAGATSAFERALSLAPQDNTLRFALAALHASTGDLGRAAGLWRAIALDTRLPREVDRAGQRLLALGPDALPDEALLALEADVRRLAEGPRQSAAHRRLLLTIALERVHRGRRAGPGARAESLRQLGQASVSALGGALGDTDDGVRDVALRLIEWTLPESAVPHLARVAGGTQLDESARALRALGLIGTDEARRVIEAFVRQQREPRRTVGLWALGLTAGGATSELMESLGAGRGPRERRLRAQALGVRPTLDAATTVTALLQDPSVEVREAAALSAARLLGREDAWPALRPLAEAVAHARVEARNQRAELQAAFAAALLGLRHPEGRRVVAHTILASLWAGPGDPGSELQLVGTLAAGSAPLDERGSRGHPETTDAYLDAYLDMLDLARGYAQLAAMPSALPLLLTETDGLAALMGDPALREGLLAGARALLAPAREPQRARLLLTLAALRGNAPDVVCQLLGALDLGAALPPAAALPRNDPAEGAALALSLEKVATREAGLRALRARLLGTEPERWQLLAALGPRATPAGQLEACDPGLDAALSEALEGLPFGEEAFASAHGLARPVAASLAISAAGASDAERLAWLHDPSATVRAHAAAALGRQPQRLTGPVRARLRELLYEPAAGPARAAAEALASEPELPAWLAESPHFGHETPR